MIEEKSPYLYNDAYEVGRILSDPNALEKKLLPTPSTLSAVLDVLNNRFGTIYNPTVEVARLAFQSAAYFKKYPEQQKATPRQTIQTLATETSLSIPNQTIIDRSIAVVNFGRQQTGTEKEPLNTDQLMILFLTPAYLEHKAFLNKIMERRVSFTK